MQLHSFGRGGGIRFRSEVSVPEAGCVYKRPTFLHSLRYGTADPFISPRMLWPRSLSLSLRGNPGTVNNGTYTNLPNCFLLDGFMLKLILCIRVWLLYLKVEECF